LLETEPRYLVGVCGHELCALMTVVELVGGAIVVPALSQDANVLVSPSADFNTLHASAVAPAAAPRCAEFPTKKDSQDVISSAERVGIYGDGTDVDVGVLARSLAGRAAIEVPDWEGVDGPLLGGIESLT